MKYIILLLIVFSAIVLFNSSTKEGIKEGNKTLSQIQQEASIQDAKDKGFDSGFYETRAAETDEQREKREQNEAELAEKTDFTKAANDFNVEYHDPPEKIIKDEGIELGKVWVFDPILKKKVAILRPSTQSNYTYYEPGIYKYGASTYVPNYTESVLLSSSNSYFNK
jgi:hypothetical protein